MSVFVDTSAIYALLNAADRDHEAATEWFRGARDRHLLTHAYVVVETLALVQHRLGAWAASRAVTGLLPTITTIIVDEDLHRSALTALVAAESRAVSLVDQVSFELMRRRGLDTAFAFDAGFTRAGFTLVPG